MQVKANGITFNYRVEGSRGAPWVMLSNSLATDLTMWDAQAAALADRFQVLRYDQRGHGRTLHVRFADQGRAFADGCIGDQPRAFRRALHGRRHRHGAGATPRRP